jgi:hypothetical protein
MLGERSHKSWRKDDRTSITSAYEAYIAVPWCPMKVTDLPTESCLLMSIYSSIPGGL